MKGKKDSYDLPTKKKASDEAFFQESFKKGNLIMK